MLLNWVAQQVVCCKFARGVAEEALRRTSWFSDTMQWLHASSAKAERQESRDTARYLGDGNPPKLSENMQGHAHQHAICGTRSIFYAPNFVIIDPPMSGCSTVPNPLGTVRRTARWHVGHRLLFQPD